ncbi:MAG: N-acetyl-gamma-glutamyl-phosphate reductase [bacterium]
MMKIGIIGAGSLTAEELLKILLRHKDVEIKVLHSETYQGKTVVSVWPAFKNLTNLSFGVPSLQEIKEGCDCVFITRPHGKASEVVKELNSSKIKVIDLSADFRLPELSYYKKWYPGISHNAPDLLSKAVYGLPELYRDKIKKSNLTANPGCYPTVVILSLAPLIKNNIIKEQIVVNAFSGVSGAGRIHKENCNLFTDIYRNLKVYKPGTHQHTPEMELALGELAQEEVKVTFIPCLVPVDRGILAISSHHLDKKLTKKDIIKIYQEFYNNEPFIRICESGYPNILDVLGTNFCDIGFEIDARNNVLMVASTIDNIVKGASGQAVQNMNLMFGFNETEGLMEIPLFPPLKKGD